MLLLTVVISLSPICTDFFFSSSLMPSLHVPDSLLTPYLFWAASDFVSGLNVLFLRQYTYRTEFVCFEATRSPALIPFLNARSELAQELLAAGQPASYACPQLHLLILYVHEGLGGYQKTILH